jgi:hypothetical protein
MLSFVFPLMSKIVPNILSMTFFSMCMTSRLCRNKLSLQYGNLKKILFFFHTTSSELHAPIFRFFRLFLLASSSLNAISSNCWRISSRMAHLERILIIQFRQMFFCSAATDVHLASISCVPYNKISSRSSNI